MTMSASVNVGVLDERAGPSDAVLNDDDCDSGVAKETQSQPSENAVLSV
jgi:hypothetical protein